MEMSKFSIIKEMRQKSSISRSALARFLEISYTHLYMLEEGQREPSLELAQRLARAMGVTVDELLKNGPGSEKHGGPDSGGGAYALAELKNELKKNLEREHKERLKAESLIAELEREQEHLLAMLDFQVQIGEIFRSESIPKSTKNKKLAKIARAAAHSGDLSFQEIFTMLRVKRSILRNWLEVGRKIYPCVFAQGGQITVCTLGEAALRLRCFDCAVFEEGKCRGYGREKSPDDIVELISRLEFHGIIGRDEQARILAESYDSCPPTLSQRSCTEPKTGFPFRPAFCTWSCLSPRKPASS
jgi:DNA-binding XRE family transcriptional regulator